MASNGSFSVNENSTLNGSVFATDIDGDTLTYSVVSGVAHGSLSLGTSGLFTYTPTANYSGPDSFTFKANDGTVDSNIATVSITVNPVDDGLGSIGDLVWNDADGNGLQDRDEAGMPGLRVRLMNANTNAEVASVIAGADGKYQFVNVTPFVSYRVKVEMPAGFIPTTQNAVTVQEDSNLDSTGLTPSFSVLDGQTDLSVDGGLVYDGPGSGRGSIGDLVFNDDNANGIQEDAEFGAEGVTVRLLNLSNEELDSTTTDTSGNYSFFNLEAGTYKVQFVVPPGMSFSPVNVVGIDEALDSDADTDTGLTGTIILGPGETNEDVDAGMFGEEEFPIAFADNDPVAAIGTGSGLLGR